MRKAIYTAIAMTTAFAAFAGVASAQVYYPQISWSPPLYYQNYGYNTNQFLQPIVQPAGVCVTCGGYGSWGGINTGTGFGTWDGRYTYLAGNNFYGSAPYGYYPNGYSYTIQDRRVWGHGDDRFIRNRVRVETFRPF